jgi:hypothetical protein
MTDSAPDRKDAAVEHEDQERYARSMLFGVRVALAALVITFAAYVTGLLPAAVPVDVLPDVWGLPVGEYLIATGMPQGWGWLALGGAETWLNVSMVLLLSVSTLGLLPLLLIYARNRDWPYLLMTLLIIIVLVDAATGVFSLID